MANYEFWALGEASVSVSGGGQLDGVTQGDGSHLLGLTITLTGNGFEELAMRDGGSDTFFDDNDSNQRLRGGQSFDGVSYGNNTRVEAEYQMVLRDPNTGDEYTVLALNFNNSSPAYATVEGLVFIDEFPPVGVALDVVSTAEGPGSFGQSRVDFTDLATPPCFTPGTMIETPAGPRPVERLRVGDLVTTLDNGPQPLRWVGHTDLSAERLCSMPDFVPIRIRRGALGPGRPAYDMLVSPQHRVLVDDHRAELLFGTGQVLAAAVHLVNGDTILRADDVDWITYIHLQCDRHEILISNGLPSESFNPGPACLPSLPDDARAELCALFPDHDLTVARPLRAARAMLNRRETLALAG